MPIGNTQEDGNENTLAGLYALLQPCTLLARLVKCKQSTFFYILNVKAEETVL